MSYAGFIVLIWVLVSHISVVIVLMYVVIFLRPLFTILKCVECLMLMWVFVLLMSVFTLLMYVLVFLIPVFTILMCTDVSFF